MSWDSRYKILRKTFGNSVFRGRDAARVLKEEKGDKIEEIPVFLSKMRKAGYLKSKPDPNDARKKCELLVVQLLVK